NPNPNPNPTTFSNVLFDADYDFDSGDDQSFSDEDFSKKIYSNPLFDEEIIPMKIDPHSFNAEYDLIDSMPNHDPLITISSKIDSLFDEFVGELTLLKSIPSGIDETDCHPEKETPDHCQPPQYTVNHHIFNAHNDLLGSGTTLIEQMEQLTSMCEMFCQFIKKKQEEKRVEEEQAAKAQNSKIPVCYDDDDDYDSAITPNEPVDSLSMGDEHLNTIPATKSDEFIKFLYDNSSPRLPEEIFSDNFNVDIESFSPSPIPNKDSDSHMEEIDLPFTLDDPMPLGIEDDDYDSGRDIPILEELLDNYSLSLPHNESYHFDIPLPYRPPAKPPDGKTRTLNIKMMGDVSDQKVPIPGLTITRILNQEKSPDLLPHQGLEAFQPSAECPRMIINGKNTPILDVPHFHFYPLDQTNIPGNLKTLAKGFFPPSLNFLSFNWES
nr:hypothetical protein [Tanacetum cinerariifolium]